MKAFIFINPSSGSGRGVKYYTNYLKPFIETNFTDNIVINLPCDNNNYFIHDIDNCIDNCIFIVGGDGTVSLTIENIMKNSDFDKLNIPIYICPFGSGNGLAKNLNIDPYKLRLDGDKKYINPINININIKSNELNLSFLSQTWGIISDIDIDTEFLRFIGDFRFYYGILKSIFVPKYYKGELDITTITNNNIVINSELDITTITNNNIVINSDFYMFCASNAPWISNDFKIATNADIFSNEIDILIIRKKISFFERIKLIYYLINENIHELDFIEYFKVSKYNLKLINTDSIIVRDGEIVDSTEINVENTDKQFLFYCFG